MRVLFLGDVVGSPGRAAVISQLAEIKKSEEVDFIIINGENAVALGQKTIANQIGASIEIVEVRAAKESSKKNTAPTTAPKMGPNDLKMPGSVINR